jgi:hypothetical protein
MAKEKHNWLGILLILVGAGIMILIIPEVATGIGITLSPMTALLGIGLVTAGLLTFGVKL